jgi:hypothetical protein
MPNLPNPDFNALLDTRRRIEDCLRPHQESIGVAAGQVGDAWLCDAVRRQDSLRYPAPRVVR